MSIGTILAIGVSKERNSRRASSSEIIEAEGRGKEGYTNNVYKCECTEVPLKRDMLKIKFITAKSGSRYAFYIYFLPCF